MTLLFGPTDNDRRCLLILPSSSSFSEYGERKPPSMTTTTTTTTIMKKKTKTKTKQNKTKQNVRICGDEYPRSIMAIMPDRSIENLVEPVLSAYLEREQGQSGAHIRRPYTGAEKGPKEARFPPLRHAGPTATSGPHQHRQHRAHHDYFRWAATAPGIGDRMNHDDHENRSRSSVCAMR